MSKLRAILCGCFGNLAALFLMVSVTTVPLAIHFVHTVSVANFNPHRVLPLELLTPTLVLLFAQPLILGLLYGMAWWNVRSGKPSGRKWAIAASVTMLLNGIPMGLQTYSAYSQGRVLEWRGFLLIDAIVLLIGIPGLVAFLPRNAMAQAGPASSPRIAGDGTSQLLDMAVWAVQLAGYFVGMGWWHRWSQGRGLPQPAGFGYWVQVGAAIFLTIVLHELGHAIVGQSLGMKLRAFIAGPFQWQIQDGRWKFKFVAARIFSMGGAAGLVPSEVKPNQRNEIAMICGGPGMNLVTALLALSFALAAKGTAWERGWEFFALLATFSFLSFAANLIPFRPGAVYSDGARIYQLLRGGPLVDLQRAFLLSGSTQVTGIRPRDYDIEAIARAAQTFTTGRYGLALRLMASEHFLDKGKFQQCRAWVAEAERVYSESPNDVPAQWHTAFVYCHALLGGDVAAARLWLERLEGAKEVERDMNYWMARSACLWIEGQADEALKARELGYQMALKAGANGGNRFSRYRLGLLRTAMEVPQLAMAS